MDDHKHGATANTREALTTFIGCRVSGAMMGVEHGSAGRQNVIAFDCGWGLGWSDETGAHWTLAPEECSRLINRRREELKARTAELASFIDAAGAKGQA